MNPLADIFNPLDIERLRAEFLENAPFPFVVIDDVLDRDFAHEVSAAYPTFDHATDQGREFSNLHERKKVQVTDAALFPAPVARLDAAMSSPEFLSSLGRITDIPDLLADSTHTGGGMHVHGQRGALDVHVDFNVLEPQKLHRRLNVIIYLNPHWRDDWGGEFEIWDPEVKKCWKRVVPAFNRCMIFRTSETSFHGVNKVTAPSGTSRVSFSAFYYTAQPPPWWSGVAHDTIYRARPTERLKHTVQMPLFRARKKFRERKNAAKQAIKGWLTRP